MNFPPFLCVPEKLGLHNSMVANNTRRGDCKWCGKFSYSLSITELLICKSASFTISIWSCSLWDKLFAACRELEMNNSSLNSSLNCLHLWKITTVESCLKRAEQSRVYQTISLSPLVFSKPVLKCASLTLAASSSYPVVEFEIYCHVQGCNPRLQSPS